MGILPPVVYHSDPGINESYDTLDDIILNESGVDELYMKLVSGLNGCVGITVGGENLNSRATDGYWGREIVLTTGEHLQMRIAPPGKLGIPLGPYDFRLVATRRTSSGCIPIVAWAIMFLPREEFCEAGTRPMPSGQTIGCRGLHFILPSLFNKHDSHRCKGVGGVQIDPYGFHSIRPSCVLLPHSPHGYSIMPGDSFLVIAGHMAGVDVPDGLRRSSEVMATGDYTRGIASKQRGIIHKIGEREAKAHICTSQTLCDLLTMEGYLGILCNSFFIGAMPETTCSPIGMPLSVCFAVHVACFPERFGLARGTKADEFANKEIMFTFHSRWKRVLLNGFRAMDSAIKCGYDDALSEAGGQPPLRIQIDDSLLLWQRMGQRLVSKIMSDPRDEVNRCGTRDVYSTRFGTADLKKDRISNAKYDHLAKKGFCKPIAENPIEKIHMAHRFDQRRMLSRILDDGEHWLRTGYFGDTRISEENVNVASASPARDSMTPCPYCGTCFVCACEFIKPARTPVEGTDTSSSDESDDVDDVMDNKLNKAALEQAKNLISLFIIHGPFSQHTFELKSYLLCPFAKNKCADCDNDVDALQASMFGNKYDQCDQCNRPRCFECSKEAAKANRRTTSCCLRCDPTAPRLRANVRANPKNTSKKAGKK